MMLAFVCKFQRRFGFFLSIIPITCILAIFFITEFCSSNDNASRFVKYIQLQFEYENQSQMKLVGSICETFLLEKARVVHIFEEESRTFHIFYQFLAAPYALKKKIWPHLVVHKVKTTSDFRYLGNVDDNNGMNIKDAENWKKTEVSLKLIGMVGQKLETLMRALCIVLQLGNVAFFPVEGDDVKAAVVSQAELDAVAQH